MSLEFSVWDFMKNFFRWVIVFFKNDLSSEEKTVVLRMQKANGRCGWCSNLEEKYINFYGKADILRGSEWLTILRLLRDKGYVSSNTEKAWDLTHEGWKVKRSNFVLDPP